MSRNEKTTVFTGYERGVCGFKAKQGPLCSALDWCNLYVLLYAKGRICGEGITDVCVLVPVIAVVLPDTGNRDGIPVGSIVFGCVELVGQIVNARKILEFPVTILSLAQRYLFGLQRSFSLHFRIRCYRDDSRRQEHAGSDGSEMVRRQLPGGSG